jgi:hypothetical protein
MALTTVFGRHTVASNEYMHRRLAGPETGFDGAYWRPIFQIHGNSLGTRRCGWMWREMRGMLWGVTTMKDGGSLRFGTAAPSKHNLEVDK